MRSAHFFAAFAGLLLAACDSDRLGTAPRPPPRVDAGLVAVADAANADASIVDTGIDPKIDASTDAAIDAGIDAGIDPERDAAIDGGIEARDADAPDAELTDSGEPIVVPGILIADPTGNQIIQLAPDGSQIAAFPSPIGGVSGVAFDRRTRDGFWITGTGNTNPIFTKLDFSGAVIDTHDYASDRLFQFLDEGVRAVDYGLGPTAADDSLIFLFKNYNNVDVVAIAHVAQVAWSGETSIGLLVGFSGVHVLNFSLSNANALEYQTTRDGRIEHWSWAGNAALASITTAIGDLGGVAVAADGTFWVTDRANISVVHVDATGATIGVPIVVQASSISDLSLIE